MTIAVVCFCDCEHTIWRTAPRVMSNSEFQSAGATELDLVLRSGVQEKRGMSRLRLQTLCIFHDLIKLLLAGKLK